jgi:predicted phage terminase large subunit-like protein
MRTYNDACLPLLEEHFIRKSRESFKDFVRYTKPDYTWGWFNEMLAERLQQFYEDYQAKKNPRLMILAPPRTGKSELASRRFPTWALGQDNTLKVISTSYASDLAGQMSRDCQRIIESDRYRKSFPETNLNSKNRRHLAEGGIKTVELWEILNHSGQVTGGGYRCAGVGGGITGQGFNIGIIDDPTKDYKEASSKSIQKRNLEWYDTTFYTRRDPIKNGIIVIMTRWHKKDLGGEIIKRMEDKTGEKFDVVAFPMEATKDEIIEVKGKKYKTRSPGDILFPERMPPSFVEGCKANPLTWTALYQQNPTTEGGNFFKSEHWRYHTPEMLANIKWKRKIITGDTAQKKNTHNDFSVFQLWGYDGKNIYLLEQLRGKFYSFELKKEAVKMWEQYGGGIVGPKVGASCFYIEDKVSGTGLIQELREEGIPCIEIPRGDDKATRAVDCHSSFHSGFVYLPTAAHWLNEYLMEFEEFKLDMTHAHDDQVDPTLDAIDILLKGKGGLNYSGYAK